MDSSSGEMSSPMGSSDDSREASSLSIAEDNTQCVPEDSKCRKSSRLKAKMDKQAQDATSGSSNDAYNLRLSSLVKRVQVERNRSTPKQPKGKSKPPPLSKYRRRTANARERMRMKDINEGYENLRQCLPDMEVQSKSKKKEKPTKFTILSLAINYIHALRDILGYPPLDSSSSTGESSIICESSSTGESSSNESSSTVLDNNNNCSKSCTITSSTRTSTSAIADEVSATTASCDGDPIPSLDAVSVPTHRVSSVPCDEICSNPSPSLATMDCAPTESAPLFVSNNPSPNLAPMELKDCTATESAPLFVPSLLHSDFAVTAKHLTRCHDPLPGSAIMMEFREEARSSPSSSASDPSLSPSPPPLPLPEDCMDLEESDLLGVSISLPVLDGMEDIVM